MAIPVTVKNPNITGNTSTRLTASANAAATSLTVTNSKGFAANDYIVIGAPGSEKAEIQQIASITNNTTIDITGSVLDSSHTTDTPITFIQWNQVRFFEGDTSAGYSTGTLTTTHDSKTITGVGTTFVGNVTTAHALLINGKFYDIASVDTNTQITLETEYEEESVVAMSYTSVEFLLQTTINIQIDQLHTVYNDTTSNEDDYYRVAFYNSSSALISALSDPKKGEGEKREEVSRILKDARVETGERTENSTSFTDEELIRLIDEAQEDVWSKSENLWWWDADININTVASQESYDLPDDFNAVLSIRGNDGTTETRELTQVAYREFRERVRNISTTSNTFTEFSLWGGRVYVNPIPTSGVTSGLKLLYRTRPLPLDSGGDVSRLPEPRVLKYYLVAKIFEIKGEPTQSSIMMGQYKEARDRMIGKELRSHQTTQRFLFNPSYKPNKLS